VDFTVPEATRALVDRVDRLVREEILPREARLLAGAGLEVERELAGLRQRVKDEGLWAPPAPRELGGLGLGLVDHAFVSEALGRTPFGHYVFGCQAPDAGNVEVLHRHGSDEQKARYLLPLVRGDLRSCFAMTEPDSPGSNPVRLASRARRDGAAYVLDGRKWFASGADGAAFALVMAVTDPDAPPHRRASIFVVPAETPGYRLVRNVPVFGQAGEGYFSHGEIELRDCRVPAEARLGPEGAGFTIAQDRLGPGRIHHCMRWVGIGERAFDLMCRRAVARRLDEDETLADKSLVQAWVSECRAGIDAARLLVLRAAWRIDAEGFEAARDEVSLVKFFAAEVLGQVLDRAIQVHGALGLTGDTPLAFFYAHERGARIYDGPDEVHKVALARRLLKRYRDAATA
jgi:alkylation response protein AidB-like acyl-CoA dehydrogenase